jgi:hypothetical protein
MTDDRDDASRDDEGGEYLRRLIAARAPELTRSCFEDYSNG